MANDPRATDDERSARTLEDREAGPQPQHDDDPATYLQRWHLWRAIRRDARLTDAELDARFRVLSERLGYPGVGLFNE